MAWAFAVVDCPSERLFGSSHFVERCAQVVSSKSHLCQLHQYALWVDERASLWHQLPAEFRERCRASFSSQPTITSNLQREVVSALADLGLDPREEVR